MNVNGELSEKTTASMDLHGIISPTIMPEAGFTEREKTGLPESQIHFFASALVLRF